MFAVHFSSRATLVLPEQSRTNGRDSWVPETFQVKQFELANTPMKTELYLGLDVHKEWILVAVAEWGRKGAVQDVGAMSNDLHALEKLLARLRKRYGSDVMVRACYEAGPCGFGIARRLHQLGVECAVVAPSLTPTRAGDRLKTDKRDARKLARLLRAGELTAIYIPEPTDESDTRSVPSAQRCGGRSAPEPSSAQSVFVATRLSLPGKKRLERSARTVFTRTGAAASGDEGDPGGVSDLGATGQRADRALPNSDERFVRQVATGTGGACPHGHERLSEGGGDDRGERTGSARSL